MVHLVTVTAFVLILPGHAIRLDLVQMDAVQRISVLLNANGAETEFAKASTERIQVAAQGTVDLHL